MQPTKTQTRGHCQLCGRIHAVLAGSGKLAKHGYEVKDGYFSGVCTGERYQPLEVDREQADRQVERAQSDAVRAFDRAIAIRAGTIQLGLVPYGPFNVKTRARDLVPFDGLEAYQKREAIDSAAWRAQRRGEICESFARSHQALIERVHGQPLAVVPVESGPAPILPGDRRIGGSGRILICAYTRGARVYWKDAQGYKGWTGTQAWRRLQVAA